MKVIFVFPLHLRTIQWFGIHLVVSSRLFDKIENIEKKGRTE